MELVTFTTEDDDNVNLKCQNESLRKHQYTTNIVLNDGTGDNDNYLRDIVCKVTGKTIQEVTKELWDEDVYVFWKKKDWVDKHVVQDIAFVCSTQECSARRGCLGI